MKGIESNWKRLKAIEGNWKQLEKMRNGKMGRSSDSRNFKVPEFLSV
ncbi:hypothetical protein [Roseimarinus sediminis]